MSRAILLPIFAATAVVAGVPVTFSQGSPAKADEVNKNFNYLDSAVGKKASQASLDAVAEALKNKADASALSGKAEQTYVDTKLSAKADTSKVRELSNALASKANQIYIDTALKRRADSLPSLFIQTTPRFEHHLLSEVNGLSRLPVPPQATPFTRFLPFTPTPPTMPISKEFFGRFPGSKKARPVCHRILNSTSEGEDTRFCHMMDPPIA